MWPYILLVVSIIQTCRKEFPARCAEDVGKSRAGATFGARPLQSFAFDRCPGPALRQFFGSVQLPIRHAAVAGTVRRVSHSDDDITPGFPSTLREHRVDRRPTVRQLGSSPVQSSSPPPPRRLLVLLLLCQPASRCSALACASAAPAPSISRRRALRLLDRSGDREGGWERKLRALSVTGWVPVQTCLPVRGWV